MTEPILATQMYPMAQYSETSVKAQWPAVGALPTVTGVKYENISTSGNKEVIYIREEETRKFTLMADGLEAQQWQQFATQVGVPSTVQFQFIGDRNLGMMLTVQNTVQDVANANPVSLTAPVSYSLVNGETVAIVRSGEGCAFSWTGSFQAPVSGNGGTIVLTFVPLFPAEESGDHILLDVGGAPSWINRAFLAKSSASQQLQFNIFGAVGSMTTMLIQSMSWVAGTDVITLISRWTNTGSLAFWASKNGGRLQVSTLSTSPGSMAITMTGSAGMIGRYFEAANPAPIKLLHFATYKYPFEDVTLLSSYFPLGRNYYDKAELQEFAITRASPTIDLWQVEMKIRQGV